MSETIQCEVAVLGGGPGGYTAAFRAADLGKKVILIEKDERIGGVCLNVGCIPSKTLLHAADIIEESIDALSYGLKFSAPEIDLDALRAKKDDVVDKLTGGLKGLAKARKVTIVRGSGTFKDSGSISVDGPDGPLEIKFKDISVVENFYMMKFFINGMLDSYALVDDKIFIAGDTISYPVMRKSFYENDEVLIRLHTVDKETFKYYNQLNDAVSDGMGPGGSSTPYNPASNFGEDVLGYFAAWSYVSETVIIQ